MSPTERFDPNLANLEVTRADEQGESEAENGDGLDGAQFDEAELDDEIELEESYDDPRERRPARRRMRHAAEGNGRRPRAFMRMYRGDTKFDFVGRRRLWFLLSGIIIVAGLISLGTRGLNLGIDFKGGTSWTVLAPNVSQTQAENAVTAAGLSNPTVEILGSSTVQVSDDLNTLSSGQQSTIDNNVTAALARLGRTSVNNVSQDQVGPTWGGQVTNRALLALITFFIVVVIYISFRFEPKMALAAFIAMLHDLAVTVGVFSLAGFSVSPDTVIAILTILGYSLYDTVVVFDRVRDNAKGLGASGRMTYTEMVNLSMNQTLARSINTSLVAILPVLAVLVIGAELLGATTLQNYGLALFVGLLSGAYSSIFIASPILAMLKEREGRYAAIRQRLDSRGDRLGLLTPSAAALLVGASATTGTARSAGRVQRQGTLRPGAARDGRAQTSAARAAAPEATGNGAAARGGGGTSRPRPGGASGARRPPPRKRGGKGGRKRR
ncbi:MAG TPA: protein translocase subunit SecF [Acidimicrobiales bacterium]|nr:protein translocase subunit SecF [Acidimicrobiales bacterium]